MSVEIIAFEIEEVVAFKPVISVTELWMKTLENTTKDFGARVTQALAEKYGFSNDEAVAFLGLESVAVNRKAMAKRSKSSKSPKEPKEKKEKKPKEEKVRLPFTGYCDPSKCQGVSYNHGLYTQCMKSQLENGTFCKSCQAQADKNASGKPDCGTMEERVASPMYEYTDGKGRSPVAYTKIMKKYGYTKEQVVAEFTKLYDGELNPAFFEESEKKKNSGRPKKASGVAVTSTDDLFTTLTAESGADMGAESAPAPKKGGKLTEEEKAEKKAKLEAERAEKKAEREAKEAIEKAERAEKRKAELATKKAEREAKKEAEKMEKEAKKAEEKAKKEAEKAEKEAMSKAEKESKKMQKKTTPVISPVVPKAQVQEIVKEVAPVEEAPKKKVGVKKIEIEGVMYFLNQETLVLYDPKTKEEVGTYDKEAKKLIPLPVEEDEEVQSEAYDSDEDQ